MKPILFVLLISIMCSVEMLASNPCQVLASFEQGPLHVRAQLSFIAEKIIPAKQ